MKRGVLPLLGLAVAFLACAMPVLALDYEGVPAKTGRASFRFGSQELTFNFVEGGFKQMQGFTTATLIFKPEAKLSQSMHLNFTLVYQAPGKVDLDGPFITLTKATSTEVEGTADCPLLHDISGEEGTPLTAAKFHATTK
jgi:hypothetical protein